MFIEDIVIGLKYGVDYWKSGRRLKELIEEIYSSVQPYPGLKEEKATALSRPSRASKEMIVKALAISSANRYRESGGDPIRLAAANGLITLAASFDDDVHDESLRYYLLSRKHSVEEIYKMISDEDFMCNFAINQKPFYDPQTKSYVEVGHLALASRKFKDFYYKQLREWDERALRCFENGLEAIRVPQAKDVYIGVKLLQDDVESIIKMLGNGDYFQNVLDILGKLGIMGSESAVIDNYITTPRNKNPEESNEALRFSFRGLTDLSQYVRDDLKRFKEDLEKRTGNVLVLLMLPEYQAITLDSMKKFIREKPKIVTDVIEPLKNKLFEGLRQLQEVNHPILSDMKLATRRVIKQARKVLKDLEKEFDVKFNWDEEAKRLLHSL